MISGYVVSRTALQARLARAELDAAAAQRLKVEQKDGRWDVRASLPGPSSRLTVDYSTPVLALINTSSIVERGVLVAWRRSMTSMQRRGVAVSLCGKRDTQC